MIIKELDHCTVPLIVKCSGKRALVDEMYYLNIKYSKATTQTSGLKCVQRDKS